jgi:hypothetical protein
MRPRELAAHATGGEEFPKQFHSAELGRLEQKGTGSWLPMRGTDTSSAARIELMIRKGKRGGWRLGAWAAMGRHMASASGLRRRLRLMAAVRPRPQQGQGQEDRHNVQESANSERQCQRAQGTQQRRRGATEAQRARMLQRAAGPCAVGQRVERGGQQHRVVRRHGTVTQGSAGRRDRVHAHAQQRGVVRPAPATAAHSGVDSTAGGQRRAAAAARQRVGHQS